MEEGNQKLTIKENHEREHDEGNQESKGEFFGHVGMVGLQNAKI